MCVVGKEASNIMWHYHSITSGGHHSGERTAKKASKWLLAANSIQRLKVVCSRMLENMQHFKTRQMPLNSMIEVEPFDCSGIDFIGHFHYQILMFTLLFVWIT